VTTRDEQQRKIRRSALLLGLLAFALYVAYYLLQLSHAMS
jgi:hypothetical protein